MSERKNINKFIKIEKHSGKSFGKRENHNYKLIRFMIPFDIFCIFCGGILREGIKIYAFKEKIISRNLLELQIFRFYFKCMFCLKGLSLKTGPKNCKYYTELNCKKIF
mmetsp:Transcript_27363/g.69023  ORF Transcript_27363/g.69023 Transcript_27363/m.69023 type:complete len:108 (+) Transcript_27363:1866-2189(+)